MAKAWAIPVGRLQMIFPVAMLSAIVNGTCGRPSPEPLYSLRAAIDLTMTIDGSTLTAASWHGQPVWPRLCAGGRRHQPDPGQQDTIAIKAMATQLPASTQQNETPSLVLGIQTASDDYEFEIRVTGDTTGQT